VLRGGLKFGPYRLFASSMGVPTPYFDRMLYCYLEANVWLSNTILNGFGQQ
jgi:hypothetical protein